MTARGNYLTMIGRIAIMALWALWGLVAVQGLVTGYFILNPSHCAGYLWHPLPCRGDAPQ